MSTSTWIVGRDPTCHLRVDDEYASPQHAVIRQDAAGNVTVADLGSTNGTWIERDGVRTRVYSGTPMRFGDVLWVGRSAIPWRKT